jgi:hypothetical protein
MPENVFVMQRLVPTGAVMPAVSVKAVHPTQAAGKTAWLVRLVQVEKPVTHNRKCADVAPIPARQDVAMPKVLVQPLLWRRVVSVETLVWRVMPQKPTSVMVALVSAEPTRLVARVKHVSAVSAFAMPPLAPTDAATKTFV